MARIDLQNRAPAVEVLPDMRLRVTRVWDVLNFEPKTSAKFLADIQIAWGTPDATYPQCLLIKQDIPEGQNKNPASDPNTVPPQLFRVYEQIYPSAETEVGNIDITVDQNATVIAEQNFLQFSSAPPVYLAVGTATLNVVIDNIPVGTTTFCVLKGEERTDDGTLRRIKRTYTSGGIISQTDDIKENGSLLIRTLVYLNQIPPTPAGFTVISKKTDYVNGLPLYTYTFAKGNGEVSRKYQSSQGGTGIMPAGTATFNLTPPITPVGAIVETVTFLTDSSVTADPTTSNLAAGVRFSVSHEDQDGYRIWTVSYGMGAGVVEFDNEYKNGAKLVLYHAVGFGAPPATPAATVGGQVLLTANKTTNADGYNIYDYRWAEGEGEISRSTEWRLSPNQGTSGVTVTTIKFMTSISVNTDPTTGPGGSEKISSTYEGSDGFKIWTAVYASGQGTIATTLEYRYNGALVIYNITSINAAPTAPTPTIGGQVNLIKNDTRNGTRFEDGTIIYDYAWAEGLGVIDKTVHYREGGLRVETWVSLGAGTSIFIPAGTSGFYAGTSIFTPPGIMILQDSEQGEGFTRWTISSMQGAQGQNPLLYSLLTEAEVPFEYPGRAKIYTSVVQDASSLFRILLDVFLGPPARALVAGTTIFTYQSSPRIGSFSPSLWNPLDYATLRGAFVNSNGLGRTVTKGLEGYAAFPAGTATFVDNGTGQIAVLGEQIQTSSHGVLSLTGGPTPPDGNTPLTLHIKVDEEPAFIGFDGTPYFRRVQVTATPQAQAALPV